MAVTRMIWPTFFVPTAVADEPRHGYGHVGKVAQLPQGRVRMTNGSLYGVPDRIAGAGLTEPGPGRSAPRAAAPLFPAHPPRAGALAEEAELRAGAVRVVRAGLERPGPHRMSGEPHHRQPG
jgi:PadR family transcriptional regulator, regulatory protein PadR